jgi:hypothetical protein
MYVRLIEHENTKKKLFAIIKDIQIDIIKRNVIHIDFLHVNSNQLVNVKIPISLINTDKQKFKVMIVKKFIYVKCYPNNIPKILNIDVSSYQSCCKIYIKDLDFLLLKNLNIIDNLNDLIIIIK